MMLQTFGGFYNLLFTNEKLNVIQFCDLNEAILKTSSTASIQCFDKKRRITLVVTVHKNNSLMIHTINSKISAFKSQNLCQLSYFQGVIKNLFVLDGPLLVIQNELHSSISIHSLKNSQVFKKMIILRFTEEFSLVQVKKSSNSSDESSYLLHLLHNKRENDCHKWLILNPRTIHDFLVSSNLDVYDATSNQCHTIQEYTFFFAEKGEEKKVYLPLALLNVPLVPQHHLSTAANIHQHFFSEADDDPCGGCALVLADCGLLSLFVAGPAGQSRLQASAPLPLRSDHRCSLDILCGVGTERVAVVATGSTALLLRLADLIPLQEISGVGALLSCRLSSPLSSEILLIPRAECRRLQLIGLASPDGDVGFLGDWSEGSPSLADQQHQLEAGDCGLRSWALLRDLPGVGAAGGEGRLLCCSAPQPARWKESGFFLDIEDSRLYAERRSRKRSRRSTEGDGRQPQDPHTQSSVLRALRHQLAKAVDGLAEARAAGQRRTRLLSALRNALSDALLPHQLAGPTAGAIALADLRTDMVPLFEDGEAQRPRRVAEPRRVPPLQLLDAAHCSLGRVALVLCRLVNRSSSPVFSARVRLGGVASAADSASSSAVVPIVLPGREVWISTRLASHSRRPDGQLLLWVEWQQLHLGDQASQAAVQKAADILSADPSRAVFTVGHDDEGVLTRSCGYCAGPLQQCCGDDGGLGAPGPLLEATRCPDAASLSEHLQQWAAAAGTPVAVHSCILRERLLVKGEPALQPEDRSMSLFSTHSLLDRLQRHDDGMFSVANKLQDFVGSLPEVSILDSLNTGEFGHLVIPAVVAGADQAEVELLLCGEDCGPERLQQSRQLLAERCALSLHWCDKEPLWAMRRSLVAAALCLQDELRWLAEAWRQQRGRRAALMRGEQSPEEPLVQLGPELRVAEAWAAALLAKQQQTDLAVMDAMRDD